MAFGAQPLLAARGLFRQTMSVTPTSANTGLNAWLNQGSATITENHVGLTLFCPSDTGSLKVHGRTVLAPSTPYTLTALFAHSFAIHGGKYSAATLGWYNGTDKLHVAQQFWGQGIDSAAAQSANEFDVIKYTDANTVLGNEVTLNPVQFSPYLWYRISDDGTTVKFQYGIDGINFFTALSTAKAGAFLGSSGYTNIVFGISPVNLDTYVTMMSWAIT